MTLVSLRQEGQEHKVRWVLNFDRASNDQLLVLSEACGEVSVRFGANRDGNDLIEFVLGVDLDSILFNLLRLNHHL